MFFKKFQKTHFPPNIWPPAAENKARNTEMYRDQETHPHKDKCQEKMN